MVYDVSKLIDYALGEVGYLEKATNNELNSKTANAGQNNFTKYGLAQGCNGQPWCDAFVDYCFIQCYGTEGAKSLLCGFSNYTPTSASYFKTNGIYTTRNPKPGDVIFFKNSSRICHTGIVYKVDAAKVYTIEGNTSSGSTLIANGGEVAKKSYALSYSRIAGYGRPNYSNTNVPQLYKGCQGKYVKTLQGKLNEHNILGGRLIVDGDFGTNTYNAVIALQGIHELKKDGIVGPTTWSCL